MSDTDPRSGVIHYGGETKDIVINGEHGFVFPHLNDGKMPLGRCKGPCGMIVTISEARFRKFGPCIEQKADA